MRHVLPLAAAGLAAATCVLAQVPETIFVQKVAEYSQLSATERAPAGMAFGIYVTLPAETAASVVEMRNSNGGVVTLVRSGDRNYRAERRFASREMLEAMIPDGPYTVVAANSAGSSSTAISVVTPPMPAPVLITNFEELQAAPEAPATARWQPIAGAGGADLLVLAVASTTGGILFKTPPIPLNSTSWTTGALPLTTPMTGSLTYARIGIATLNNGATAYAIGAGFSVLFPVRAAPVITGQPLATTVPVGGAFTLSVAAMANLPLQYQWCKYGVPMYGATNATFEIATAQSGHSGDYTVRVSTDAGTVVSTPARVDVGSAAESGLTVTFPATAYPVEPGSTVVIVPGVGGTATSYTWLKDGVAIPGATGSSLHLPNVQPGQGGSYNVVAGNAAGVVTSTPVNVFISGSANTGRIANLSIRSVSGAGTQTLVAGLAVGGSGQKPLLLRGIGPALEEFGVSGSLHDPVLTLYQGTESIGGNDDWTTPVAEYFPRVGAFPLPPQSTDSAMSAQLATGTYTVQVRGKDSPGVALAEVYDLAVNASAARLINVSARSHTGSGGAVLIAGFVITGDTTRTLVIRGIGPSLAPYGIGPGEHLADPKIELYSSGKLLASNGDWGGDSRMVEAFAKVGAFPLDRRSKDAALLISLPPGPYSVQVSGTDGTTGVALVEVYDVQ